MAYRRSFFLTAELRTECFQTFETSIPGDYWFQQCGAVFMVNPSAEVEIALLSYLRFHLV